MMKDDDIERVFDALRDGAFKPRKIALILFDGPEDHTLYSDAAAADLVPVLKALLARIESGALRMPVTYDLRWVEETP